MSEPFPQIALRLAVALVAVSITSTAGLPLAEAADPPTEQELKSFEFHVRQGAELYKSGDYQKALDAFRRARAIVDHPQLVFRIARTLHKLERCKAAENAYRSFLDRADPGQSQRAKVNRYLRELESCTSTGTLELTCRPAEAVGHLGGESFECPATMELDAGSHVIRVTAADHIEQAVDITVEPGETTRRSVELEPEPSSVGAGGRTSPPSTTTADGGPRWITPTKWVALGVGAGLFGGGLVSDATAVGRNEDIAGAEARGDWARVDTLTSQAKSARNRTLALYIAGGAVLTGGLTLFVIDATRDIPAEQAATTGGPEARIRVGPARLTGEIRW